MLPKIALKAKAKKQAIRKAMIAAGMEAIAHLIIKTIMRLNVMSKLMTTTGSGPLGVDELGVCGAS